MRALLRGHSTARHLSPTTAAVTLTALSLTEPESDGSNTGGEMSQSHLAHRLTEYAGQVNPAVQLAVAMDIFNMYHVHGVHLSERNALAEIGVKNGLFASKDAGIAWLAGGACDLEVKKQYQTAQRMGITGVPFFVFQDKYAASGAMGVDEFVDVSGCFVAWLLGCEWRGVASRWGTCPSQPFPQLWQSGRRWCCVSLSRVAQVRGIRLRGSRPTGDIPHATSVLRHMQCAPRTASVEQARGRT